MVGGLPSGRVTFAFTDVVGSTRLFAEHGDRFETALRGTLRQIRDLVADHGGAVVKTEGDGAFLAFDSAPAAVACLQAVQAAPRTDDLVLPMRAGAHIGDAVAVDGDYVSFAVHVTARIASAAGGGQVLVSDEVIQTLPEPVGERLGAYELRDLSDPMVLWRVAGEGPPARATPARRTNVALPHTSFVGRDAETARLSELLEHPGVITVVGPGGVGKTRLVSELARLQAPLRAGGAWLVELSTVEHGEEVATAIAAVLHMTGAATPDTINSNLLRRGDVLLVADNCEHVLDEAADLLAALALGCPQLRILATSREPLAIAGETVFRLPALAIGDEHETGPAERLFTDRAAQAGARLDAASVAAVARVCRQLDGLPMAVELAAAHAGEMPMDALYDALRDGAIDLRRRGGEKRQQSFDDLVDWTLSRVPAAEGVAALALSALPAGFGDEIARPVLGATGMTAVTPATLSRRSLVDYDGDRYRMLAPIRLVCRRRLAERPDLERDVHDGLLEWSLGLPAVKELDHIALGSDLDTYLTLEETYAWAAAHGWPEGSGRLAPVLVGWSQEYLGTQRLATLCAEVLAAPPDLTSVDRVLQLAASLSMPMQSVPGQSTARSEWTAARERQLVDTARRLARGNDLAYCLDRLAYYHLGTGNAQAAMRYLAEAESIDGLNDRRRFIILNNLGVASSHLLDLDAAERWMRAAMQHAPADDLGWLCAVDNLAELLLDQGRPLEAIDLLRRGLHADTGGVSGASGQALFAEALLATGRLSEARQVADVARRRIELVLPTDPSIRYYVDRLDGALEGARRTGYQSSST
jgi:class 3 adenylate cyclase